MAIFAGITASKKLGGIFGLSCYLLLHEKFKTFLPTPNTNQETPIFMGHGDSDPTVLPQWGKLSADLLKKEGYQVELKTYRGLKHSADQDEIDDVEKFLNEKISAVGENASL